MDYRLDSLVKGYYPITDSTDSLKLLNDFKTPISGAIFGNHYIRPSARFSPTINHRVKENFFNSNKKTIPQGTDAY